MTFAQLHAGYDVELMSNAMNPVGLVSLDLHDSRMIAL